MAFGWTWVTRTIGSLGSYLFFSTQGLQLALAWFTFRVLYGKSMIDFGNIKGQISLLLASWYRKRLLMFRMALLLLLPLVFLQIRLLNQLLSWDNIIVLKIGVFVCFLQILFEILGWRADSQLLTYKIIIFGFYFLFDLMIVVIFRLVVNNQNLLLAWWLFLCLRPSFFISKRLFFLYLAVD